MKILPGSHHFNEADVKDTPRDCFIKAWEGGYGATPDLAVVKCLEPYYNKEHVALEIGCGRGSWTQQCLSPNFKKVICLDVIPKSKQIATLPNVEYVELPDRDFTCNGVADDSVDFVWSFGCFCHLSADALKEYLSNIFKKMKSGSHAITMFGNWPRHPQHHSLDPNTEYPPEQCPWFYQDLEIVKDIITNAGFPGFEDMLPNYRDTIAHFVKL